MRSKISCRDWTTFDYCLFLVEMAGTRTLVSTNKWRVACLPMRLNGSKCVFCMAVNDRRRLSGGVAPGGHWGSSRAAVWRTSSLFVCLPAGITDRRSIQARKTTPRDSALNPPFPTAAHWTLQADVNWVVLMPSNCKYCFMSDWLHPTDPSPAPFALQPLLRPPLGIYADKLTRINIYVKQKGPLKSAGGRNVCENPSAYGPYRTHGWLFKRKRHQEKM